MKESCDHRTLTGRLSTGPETAFHELPPLPPPTGRIFQSFVQWLKNDRFHRQGQYCEDAACRICESWRLIHQAQMVPCEYYIGCDDAAQERVSSGVNTGLFSNYCYPHAAIVKERIARSRLNTLQVSGFERGHQVALDALVDLATEPLPESELLPETEEEKAALAAAIWQGFSLTIYRNLPPV